MASVHPQVAAHRYRSFSWQPDAFGAADLDEYLRTYTQPGALSAGFAYYRNIPVDTADNRALLEAGLRLPMPCWPSAADGPRRVAAAASRKHR
jgi:hypothetical protein